MPEDYSKELWGTFLKICMHDAILDLASGFPDRHSLEIPYSILEDSWKNLTGSGIAIKFFISHPELVLSDAREALEKYNTGTETPKEWGTVEVKITGYPTTTIRDLRHEHIEKFVSVTGTIMRKTEVRFRIIKAAFECQRCGGVTEMPQAEGEIHRTI